MATEGYGAIATTEAFARAREMSMKITNTDERFGAMYGLWASSYVRGDLPAMTQISENFVRETLDREGTPLAIAGHRCMGGTAWFNGDYPKAKAEFKKAMASFSSNLSDDKYIVFGHDLRMATTCSQALTLWPMGLHSEARILVARSKELADSTDHLWSKLYTHIHLCIISLMIGESEDEACRRICEPSLALAKDNGLALFVALTTMIDAYRGNARCRCNTDE